MTKTRITISSIVGGGFCVAADDGQAVYKEIYRAISTGERVELSFFGVTRMTTAFLNAAVGQLYGEFSEDYLKSVMLPPVEFDEWHLKRLKIVVDRAKDYFKDAERIEKIIRDNSGG